MRDPPQAESCLAIQQSQTIKKNYHESNAKDAPFLAAILKMAEFR